MPEVTCPNCQTRLNAPEGLRGREVTCGQCRRTFVIPSEAGSAGIAVPSGPAAPPLAAGPPPPPLSSPISTQGHTSGFATASLVLGIVSIPANLCYSVPGLVCGILAIIFSAVARRAVARGTAGGSSLGLARAGLICGIISIVVAVLFAIMVGYLIWRAETRAPAGPVYYGP